MSDFISMLRSEPWMKEARCAGMDPSLFVLDRGTPSTTARRACSECKVTAQCENYAIRTGSVGIWGGRLFSEPAKESDREVASRVVFIKVSDHRPVPLSKAKSRRKAAPSKRPSVAARKQLRRD